MKDAEYRLQVLARNHAWPLLFAGLAAAYSVWMHGVTDPRELGLVFLHAVIAYVLVKFNPVKGADQPWLVPNVKHPYDSPSLTVKKRW